MIMCTRIISAIKCGDPCSMQYTDEPTPRALRCAVPLFDRDGLAGGLPSPTSNDGRAEPIIIDNTTSTSE